ncbi:hypothetical protein [Rhizobium giardinii]|uniref:hypothetical protein n=1 Tax=Rhizobium giardinii TaxID=56731 RepID=UPI003D6E8D13
MGNIKPGALQEVAKAEPDIQALIAERASAARKSRMTAYTITPSDHVQSLVQVFNDAPGDRVPESLVVLVGHSARRDSVQKSRASFFDHRSKLAAPFQLARFSSFVVAFLDIPLEYFGRFSQPGGKRSKFRRRQSRRICEIVRMCLYKEVAQKHAYHQRTTYHGANAPRARFSRSSIAIRSLFAMSGGYDAIFADGAGQYPARVLPSPSLKARGLAKGGQPYQSTGVPVTPVAPLTLAEAGINKNLANEGGPRGHFPVPRPFPETNPESRWRCPQTAKRGITAG